MPKFNIPPTAFDRCGPLLNLRDVLLAYTNRADRPFLTDGQVEFLLSILSIGRVACLEVPHVATLAARPPTERPNVPFGTLGTLCGVARRASQWDNVATDFYAPFIALPLSGRSHFSVLIVDPADQCAYHFDSRPGMHDEIVDALLRNNWRWMMPTAAGAEPTIEQLRARITRLYHSQRNHNCGIVVARVVRQLELRMAEAPHEFAVAARRPALMQRIFETAVADDRAIDEYRVRLAEAIDDFVTLHVAASVLSGETPNSPSSFRALMPCGITAASALEYLRGTRVEANLFVSWLTARFVWFSVFSTLSAAALVATMDAGMPALFVNCSSEGSTVFGATLLLPPCGAHAEWTVVGTMVSACLTETMLPARLNEIAGASKAYKSIYIREQMDQLTPLVVGVAAAMDARLWNAGSNQRGWVAAHAVETADQLVTSINATLKKSSKEQRERNAKLSAVVGNGCYGLLARNMHEHVRSRMAEADKRALAKEGFKVGNPVVSDVPDPLQARRRELWLNQDGLLDRVAKVSLPQLELCYNDASTVYNHVASMPAVLDLVREINKYVVDSCAVGIGPAMLYEILARLSHTVPVLWARAGDISNVIHAVHNDMISPMLLRGSRPVILPVYVFYLNPPPPPSSAPPSAAAAADDEDDQWTSGDIPRGADAEAAASAVPRDLQKFHGIWSLPDLIHKITTGEAVPSEHVPMLSKANAATVVKMVGTCIMWPSASDVRPNGSVEFGAFVSCITQHPALAQLQCHEGRYPWICLDMPEGMQLETD